MSGELCHTNESKRRKIVLFAASISNKIIKVLPFIESIVCSIESTFRHEKILILIKISMHFHLNFVFLQNFVLLFPFNTCRIYFLNRKYKSPSIWTEIRKLKEHFCFINHFHSKSQDWGNEEQARKWKMVEWNFESLPTFSKSQ